jgi:hypothetical protein
MQVGAIMSGPPWRVGLRTTREGSQPPRVRQPQRCPPDSRARGRPNSGAATPTAGSGPRGGRRTTRACGRRRRRSGTRGSGRCAGWPRRHERSVRVRRPISPASSSGRSAKSKCPRVWSLSTKGTPTPSILVTRPSSFSQMPWSDRSHEKQSTPPSPMRAFSGTTGGPSGATFRPSSSKGKMSQFVIFARGSRCSASAAAIACA